uniref:Transthyretin-like family protein n=1 Tax=Steinernema glaseri TaxID=37863 RepID=A0A1I7Z514_9BILA
MRATCLLLGCVAGLVTLCYAGIIPEQFTGQQSYKVTGRLLCGETPASNIRVKLVDDDFGPDPDDDLQSGYTNDEGYFELSGDTTELTTIDPHLKIYHDCNDGIAPCQRRWKFELPNHYITKGNKPHNTLDIGTWNLEAKMPGESHDCIH